MVCHWLKGHYAAHGCIHSRVLISNKNKLILRLTWVNLKNWKLKIYTELICIQIHWVDINRQLGKLRWKTCEKLPQTSSWWLLWRERLCDQKQHTEGVLLLMLCMLIWVAGALVFALLFFKVHNYMLYTSLYLWYLQQEEINLSHFHLIFGNKILYWYQLM